MLSDFLWVRPVQKWTKTEIELKSLILAQIERWRYALHMQVERILEHAPKLVANVSEIYRNISGSGG